MTADQREQALAALDRLTRKRYTRPTDGQGLASHPTLLGDRDLVRAALTPPPLPADLAEVQARVDAREALGAVKAGPIAGRDARKHEYAKAAIASARDVPALVAELSELRARPTLTAEEAAKVVEWVGDFRAQPDHWIAGIDRKLRAIAGGKS